jgi:hypothetical protein
LVIVWAFRETSSDGILDDVEHAIFEFRIRPNNTVKGFGFPECSLPTKQFIHAVAGRSFNAVHDFCERIRFILLIEQGCKEHMYMGRHHDERMHVNFTGIFK